MQITWFRQSAPIQSLNQRIKEIVMSRILKGTIVGTVLAVSALAGPTFAQGFDADAAQALAKKNDCMKCHSVDKDKKAPSYKKIAAKYKGKPDGEEKAIKNITSGQKVKLEDGTEEDHKIINTKDPAAIKNIVNWILAQ